MAVTLDREAMKRGIGIYLGIAVPSAVVVGLIDGSNSTGAAFVLFVAAVLIFLVAPLMGGAAAGRAQQAPFVHGALIVALPGAAFLVVRIADGLIRGNLTAVDVVTFLLYFVIEVGLGMLGGYFGFRRGLRAT